jgi:predicted DsbA family dithiol-disulfide isomerase
MAAKLKIDFVSDVVCPWCAIGLAALEQALDRTKGEVEAEVHFQPFELNPQMPPEGQNISEHLTQKYGSTPEQQAQAREGIRQRGAALGFTFRKEGRDRTWNTFDAHRLLYWAGLEGADRQYALKKALLQGYHGEGESPADHEVLARTAGAAGLDVERARAVLASDEYAAEVRERERFYTDHGIHAVPSVIINDRHLIQGGQPVEAFEQALRRIALEA